MNSDPHEESVAPQLSRVRTFLFLVLAVDWFAEALFLGVPTLSKVWASLWYVPIPENPQLAAALSITQAIEASAKGAFFVMAVFGLRSRNPHTRTVLFASMALVPPLNIAFPLRQLGSELGPLTVAASLSVLLWGTLLLFRERVRPLHRVRADDSMQSRPSTPELVRYSWLSFYSVMLTSTAILFLFWPMTGLSLIFPWLAELRDTNPEALSGLIASILPVGTQLLALAVGSWFATLNSRSNPSLRKALTLANTVHAGLFSVLPLLLMALEFETPYTGAYILFFFALLFVCWVLYGVFYEEKSWAPGRFHGVRSATAYTDAEPTNSKT